MNARLKELALKCNFTEQDIKDMSPGLEEFAQLIMDECANACNDFSCGRTMNAEDLIKAQFGVNV
jgi:hypothetical protein